jgi:uncharacterized protein (TIGR01319 family)
VLRAAELLSRGSGKTPGAGELMVFDVGGATTDVCSMAKGAPTRQNVFMRGLPQPFSKRTVEGDLGLRYSQPSLLERAGFEAISERLGMEASFVLAHRDRCRENPAFVPAPGSPEKRLDDGLAREAVRIAMSRHCGTLETVWTAMGSSFVQTGKDLSEVPLIIGTGGPIIDAADPAYVLSGAVYGEADLNQLKPVSPRLVADSSYSLSAMGTLSRFDEKAALAIMKANFGVD